MADIDDVMETGNSHIDYPHEKNHNTLGVVFMTAAARDAAAAVLRQHTGGRLVAVCPNSVADIDWLCEVAPHGRSLGKFDADSIWLDNPISILAELDALHVIADAPTPSLELAITEPVEDLLWLALELGIEAHYHHLDGTPLPDVETCLKRRGVPARAMERRRLRQAHASTTTVLRLDNDYGHSGVSGEHGGRLDYDDLDVPFWLVRRIAAWQRDFDDTCTPPDKSNAAWQARHAEQELEIALAMQAALGSRTDVQIFRQGRWLSAQQAAQIEQGEAT